MMKRISLIVTLILFSALFAQGQQATVSTGRIDSLKDSWGEYYYYTGDIKNKQPNGLGIAHYDGSYVLWYAGYFLNGKYDGKGVLLFKDGFFLSGNWKAGKLNGEGANLTKDKELYIGNYSNGVKSGRGNYFFKDNSLIIGNFKNDKYDGRCIYINAAGDIISDNIYTVDKKNGPGYQYEVGSKKLYKGNWKDGEWQEATEGSYKSFLVHSDFIGEKSDDHILMGPIDKSNDNMLTDTSFYYDLEKKKKYFGLYKAGFLQNGITMRDDSSVFSGGLTRNGANGYCHFYKVGKYYDEGNYVEDFLQGPNCLSIDLEKKTLYYGEMTNQAEFTGKAWFVSKSGSLYNGTYEKGSFTGYGSKITLGGLCIRANWEKGVITTLESITDNKGQKLNLKPASISETISLMSRLNEDDINGLLGDEELIWTNDKAYTVYQSYFQLPNTEATYIVEDDDYYLSTYSIVLATDDYEKATALYKSICGEVKNAKPVVEAGAAPVTMVGETINPETGIAETISIYKASKKAKRYDTFSVAVRLIVNTDEEYEVSVVYGDEGNAFTY